VAGAAEAPAEAARGRRDTGTVALGAKGDQAHHLPRQPLHIGSKWLRQVQAAPTCSGRMNGKVQQILLLES